MTDDELSVFKGAMDPECATLHASLVTTTLALHAEKNVNERVSCRNKCSDAALCQASGSCQGRYAEFVNLQDLAKGAKLTFVNL